MNRDLLIVGMRRTGTTILFDGFVRDPRFTTLYEPLNLISGAPLLGGGSGVHQVDLYDALRTPVREFLASRPDLSAIDLNYGGPTRADVEVDDHLPEHIESYLAHVLGAPGPKVAKFVRLPTKIRALHRVAPQAALIWTVRDPRLVARSYLHGRDGKFAELYADADAWFGRTTPTFNRWSIGVLSDTILQSTKLQTPAAQTEAPPTDLERVLLVWKHSVKMMAADAALLYGSASMRLRHEDFCAAPATTMRTLCSLAGLEADETVCSWLESTVTAAAPVPFEDDARWHETFERLGMSSLVRELDYQA